ncbi:MAG: c-type cytochrome [Rhodospirillales bacterium]
MSRRARIALASVLAAALAGGTAAAQDPKPGAGDAKRGEELFRKCVACHTLEEGGRNKAGPRLHGLFGRKAGGVGDFKYSPALRDSDLVWTPETVDALFAKGPDVLTPGSKMPLQTMTNAKDRADLIAYLMRATAK